MTSCVPCRRRPIEINNDKTNPKITMGHFSGCRKQQSSMRKPGIPPARIPEITKSSLHGMTFTLTLWCKHRQSRVAFFPPVWPIRTRLGPYNCVSSEKQKCTRTRVVQKLWQIITKPKTKQQNHHNQKRLANPQPDLRFASNQDSEATKNGAGPNKTKTTLRFALDTVTLATVSSSKTCKLIIHCGSARNIVHHRPECLTWEQIRESSVAGRLVCSTTEAACMDVLSISTLASLLFILHHSAYASKSVPVNIHRRKE